MSRQSGIVHKNLHIVAGVLIAGGVALLVFTGAYQTCARSEHFTVRGSSMKGIFEDGQEVRARIGYYRCHDVSRDDFVLYKYAGSEKNPFIKVVKGLPGDTLTFIAEGEDSYKLVLNNELLTTTTGQSYIVTAVQKKILTADLRENKLVAGGYLILGNISPGSFDGRSLGLVGKSDLSGRVYK